MKIIRFEAKGIHGFLDLEVDFNDDLTFLTGINGCGKTSVVNGITALIAPSLTRLAVLQYECMKLHISHSEQEIVICAKKIDEATLILSIATDKEDSLEIPILLDDDMSPSRRAEMELEFYREQEARYANDPVIKRIKELPTPMFLGMERRAPGLFGPDERLMREDYLYNRSAISGRARLRNAFASSISVSLAEAIQLAENTYRENLVFQQRKTNQLRKKILLSALEYIPSENSRVGAIESGEAFIEQVDQVRETFSRLGISERDIDKKLSIFVEKIQLISEHFSLTAGTQEVFDKLSSKSEEERKQILDMYLEWTINRPQFERILTIVEHARWYSSQIERSQRPIHNYINTVNNFLRDSHKKLVIDPTGSLKIQLNNGDSKPVSALSSGESQLVVILTHIAFNPAAQEANVFIVDEPELSLHLRWQELFVDAVRSLNPDIQSIMATHSPSIILDMTDKCFDLSKQKTQK